MAGITNPAFRRVCREYGAGLFVSEMITARGLVEDSSKSWARAAFDPDESPRSIQLYGADPCDANRCPACAVHLGPSGLGHITFRIERHLKALDQSLRDLADHPGAFTVDSTIVRSQVLASIDQLDDPPPLNTSTRVVPAAPH